MHVVAVTCQNKCNSADGLQALLDVISEMQPKWDIVAFAEADFLGTNALTWDAGCKHRTFRHWLGDGSRAMRRLADLHAKVKWSGRTGLLLVSLGELPQRCAEGHFAAFLLHVCHSLLSNH